MNNVLHPYRLSNKELNTFLNFKRLYFHYINIYSYSFLYCPPSDVDYMFEKFDVDDDQKVDKVELLNILRGFGCDATQKEVNNFFALLDVDTNYILECMDNIECMFPCVYVGMPL